MCRRPQARGFTLVELAVTLAIVALLLTLGTSRFGNSVRAARERSVPEKFLQDFGWARGAAGAGDASALGAGLSGVPNMTMSLQSDCSWTTKVNGTTVGARSMSAAQLTALGLSMTCTGGGVLVTYAFDSQGSVGTSGAVTFTGLTNQWLMQVLTSGSVIRTKVAS